MSQTEPRRIAVPTRPPYEILAGQGVSDRLPEWLRSARLAARYALVSDSDVAPLHAGPMAESLSAAGLAVETIVFPAGEPNKTRATKERVEDALARGGCGRDTAILALGGGVVCDLAGFVAATWMRGIPCVQVPTSLIAMVDASVGGKTAVDHPRGKNLIGAFHQPAAVFIDTRYLATLPERQFRAGLAEIVKAAVVRDTALLALLERETARIAGRDSDLMAELIARACAIKVEVVAADERESDLRKILNFGHTVAHALERLAGYTVPHGEAVSIGMIAEARLAAAMGLLEAEEAGRIEAILVALGLPARPSEIASTWAAAGIPSAEALLEAARMDKKARGGRIVCALPARIGEMARGPGGYGLPVDDALALSILGEILAR